MIGGLSALLDDVVMFTKLAAKSTAKLGAAAGRTGGKAAGVVIDDTAVTPAYVHGVAAERELSIVWRITKGSLRNKFLYILPVCVILSVFSEKIIHFGLLAGGSYLAYEAAAKLTKHHKHHEGEQLKEDEIVKKAVRTDLVLSAEIMAIALNEANDLNFLEKILTLSLVALLMTILVYGVVGIIVKLDDAGVRLVETNKRVFEILGRGLIKLMLGLLKVLSIVGIAAMAWVGGHIVAESLKELGQPGLYATMHEIVHNLEEGIFETFYGRGVAVWAVETFFYGLFGAGFGIILLFLKKQLSRLGSK